MFAPGDRVRTNSVDPPHHTRLPRYARGRVGTVVEVEGQWPLADASASATGRANATATAGENVYAVRFDAIELWGSGGDAVVLDLWESYLEQAS